MKCIFCFTAIQGGLTPVCNPLQTPVANAFHVQISELLQYQGNSAFGAASFKSGKLQAGNPSGKKMN